MDLITHAEGLGAEVRYAECLDSWGRYDHRTGTIWLLSGMGVTQWRSTLGHECGHAFWGHSRDGPREERQADQYAVKILMPLPLWARATASVETPGGLAQELGVLPRLVHVAHDLYQGRSPCGL